MEIILENTRAISIGQRSRVSGGVGTPYNRMKKNITDTLRRDTVMFDSPLYIKYKFFYKGKKDRDLDNILKGVNDALVKSNILKDDSLIHKIKCEKQLNSNSDKIEIKISKYNI